MCTPSGPGDVSLRDHIDSRLRSLEERLQAHERAQYREIEQAQKQADEVRIALEGRLAEMNQLHAQITSERGEFVTRDVLDARLASAESRVGAVADRSDSDVRALAARVEILERMRANLEGRMWAIGAALAGLVVLIQLAMRFLPVGR